MSKSLKEMLNPKQIDFMLYDDRRINLLTGSVRSGKTYVSLLKWAVFVGSMPENSEFLMTGKTITSLKRNCLGLLQDLVGDNFKYSLSQKSGTLFGRRIWLEGANDDRAESKIRGMTLAGAYVDELTQIPEDFYRMLLSRLSMKGAKLYATTNPDTPTHWVKLDIIDNEEIDKKIWHFTFDDNEILKKENVRHRSFHLISSSPRTRTFSSVQVVQERFPTESSLHASMILLLITSLSVLSSSARPRR